MIETLEEARNPTTAHRRLVELFQERDAAIMRALLENPNLCPIKKDGKLDASLFEWLAEKFPEEITQHPGFVLHALIDAKEDLLWTVMNVVERSKDGAMIERLLSLYGASNDMVRAIAATNLHCPEPILRVLGHESTETCWMVREAVAKNSNTPEDVLRRLKDHEVEPCKYVNQAAKITMRERGIQ